MTQLAPWVVDITWANASAAHSAGLRGILISTGEIMRPSSCATLTLLAAALFTGCVADETNREEGGGGAGLGPDTGGNRGEGGDESGAGPAGGAAPTETLATVRLRDGVGHPGVALTVISNAPDGSLVAEAVSDEDGEVELVIPVDGSVSAVYTSTYQYADPEAPLAVTRYVDTIVFDGLPGDSVQFRVNGSAAAPPLEQMTVMIAAPALAGAASYDVSTSCKNSLGNATSSKVLQISNCRPDDLFDAVVVARNAAGEIIDHATLANAPFTSGEYQSYDLAWLHSPVGSVEFQIENIPAGAAQVYLSSAATQSSNGGGTWATTTVTVDNPASEITRELAHLESYGNRHCLYGLLMLENSASRTSAVSRQRCSPEADLSPIVFDAEELARLEPTVETESPLTIAVSESSPGSYGQVLTTTQRWLRNSDNGYWRAYAKPGPRTLRFPQLPPALAAYALATTDAIDRTNVMNMVAFGVAESFEEAVVTGLPLAPDVYWSADVGVAP